MAIIFNIEWNGWIHVSSSCVVWDKTMTVKFNDTICNTVLPPERRPMDLAYHHLETIRQEKTTRETSHAVERRPGHILERHDLAEGSTRQGNLEPAC